MLHSDHAGMVMVNGRPRRIEVSGNPLGRTVIRVDGVAVHDKKPFIAKEVIEFNLAPGKAATLRWQQVSALGMECDITVDGVTTTLSKVKRDGTVVPPVGEAGRWHFVVRAVGAAAITFGAVFLFFNYDALQRGGHARYLGFEPIAIGCGIAILAKPSLVSPNRSPKISKIAFYGAGAAIVIVALIFRSWLLSAFAAR